MTPVERLQAAIEKLESLKATSTPGPWRVDEETKVQVWFPGGATILEPEDWSPRGDNHPEENAALVVTLHRTIDAQLAILREALFQLQGSVAVGFIGNEFNLFTLLADAILGSDL